MDKELKNMTFAELVEWSRGHILIGIGNGDYWASVWTVCQTVLQWKELQDKPRKKKKGGS